MRKKLFSFALGMYLVFIALSAFAIENHKIILSASLQKSSLTAVYKDVYELKLFSSNPYIPAKIVDQKLGGNGKWIKKNNVLVLATNKIFASFYPSNNLLVYKKDNQTHVIFSKIIEKDNHFYLSLDVLPLFDIKYYYKSGVCSVYATTWRQVYEKELDAFADYSKVFADVKPKLLTKYSTRFNSSYVNRTSNIQVASKAIEGIIVPPGEVFSFNKTLGKRTPQAGYKKAIIFINKQKVEDYGGGICQVSSTIFNAVYKAKLPILQRKSHSIDVTYVPKGMDATVSYGLIDFVFRNNKKMPILLNTEVKKNRLTVKLFKY